MLNLTKETTINNRFEGFESHYMVTFKKDFVDERHLKDNIMYIHCYLTESGNFNYGNHSAMVVETMICGKSKIDSFDTRYERGISKSPKSFKKWTYKWIKEGNQLIDINGIKDITVLPDWGYKGSIR